MATSGSGAVFFLGTRAHYQVLQQPETKFDVENGNSTETIYQNRSVQWPEQKLEVDNPDRWYCDENTDEREQSENILRSRRRPSEITLCEKEDMKPALLNNIGNNNTAKCDNCSRKSLMTLLWSLARRKKRHATDEPQYLQRINAALNSCTYRESCRCLDCQSRYFECDEDSEGYSSDDSYSAQYVAHAQVIETPRDEPEEDDEVFIDTVPEDTTSTDLLIEDKKMSTSSEDTEAEDKLQLEVAAGTPVLLNYLLTHPITCTIQ